ncbi:MAG TPA: CHASE2 domain-containing protein, partial [Roseiarcus sp.]
MKWLIRLARRFGLARALCVGLLAALALLRISDPYPLEEIRNRTFDLYQAIRPRVATEKPVAIVDIDEKSLGTVGQWPWPRTRVADLIKRLTELGAASIGFDIIFPEPDRMSPTLAAETFRDLDDATRDKLRALPSNDQVMADAVRASRVVLGESALSTVVPSSVQTPPIGLATFGDPKPFLLSYPGLLRNIPVLESA